MTDNILPCEPTDESRYRLLDNYIAALDEADMDTVLAVLEAASRDPILDRLLTEATSELHREAVERGELRELTEEEANRAREMIRLMLLAADKGEEAANGAPELSH